MGWNGMEWMNVDVSYSAVKLRVKKWKRESWTDSGAGYDRCVSYIRYVLGHRYTWPRNDEIPAKGARPRQPYILCVVERHPQHGTISFFFLLSLFFAP
jgi:hypothetical protein